MYRHCEKGVLARYQRAELVVHCPVEAQGKEGVRGQLDEKHLVHKDVGVLLTLLW